MAEHLLPDNSSAFLKSLSVSQARILDVDMDVIRRAVLANISPASLLPWLAWDRSVDEYSEAWPESQRRAAVAGSFPYHKVKGTPFALKRALGQLDYETTVSEWFQYGGDPYLFRVEVASQTRPLTTDDYAVLRRLIRAAKNTRSKLDSVVVSTRFADVRPYVAAWGAREVIDVTIYPEAA